MTEPPFSRTSPGSATPTSSPALSTMRRWKVGRAWPTVVAMVSGSSSGDVAVARLTDTSLDTTFSNLGINPNNPSLPPNGIAHLDGPGFPGKPDDAPVTSVLVQPDGKIIAAHGTGLTRLTAT